MNLVFLDPKDWDYDVSAPFERPAGLLRQPLQAFVVGGPAEVCLQLRPQLAPATCAGWPLSVLVRWLDCRGRGTTGPSAGWPSTRN
jgi:hypothetical protein